jgi:hypothetical protein
VTHLWEANHPYYCNEGNYYTSESIGAEYKSWGEFVASEGDADLDMNLIFRFDWLEGEDHDLLPYNGDDYYRNGKLMLFYMGQRKGLYRYCSIEVCRADEPAVSEWLMIRWNHMKLLWAPLSGAEAS